jgi:hypothetical protein
LHCAGFKALHFRLMPPRLAHGKEAASAAARNEGYGAKHG